MKPHHRFVWRAVYSDGSELNQYRLDGSHNSYHDIDRTKLARMELIDQFTGLPHVVLHLKKGQRLVYRMRSRIKMPFGGGWTQAQLESYERKRLKGEPDDTVILLGWQQNVQGRNVQNILFVHSDGVVESMPGYSDSHPLYKPIEPSKKDNLRMIEETPVGANELKRAGECSQCGECCRSGNIAYYMHAPGAKYCRYLTETKQCRFKLGLSKHVPTRHLEYYRKECLPYPDPKHFKFSRLPSTCTFRFVNSNGE